MTVDWLFAIAYIAGFVAFLVAAVRLVRRSERRLDAGQFPPTSSGAPDSGAGDPVAAYLDRMSGELRLPAADVAEVRAELSDHLQDSIASLEAEGLDHERATREALARLGSADELGRHLRHAHQSTRRLLAGAGGGVFAAGGGWVLGYMGGWVVAILLTLLFGAAITVLTRIGLPMPDLMGDHGDTVNSLLIGIANAMAAGVAVRYAVRTSAGLSRRAPRSIAVFWAVAGAVGFGWYAIFGLHGLQSWPGVVLELSVPLFVIAAATVRIDRPMPHVGRWAVAIVGLSVLGTGLMFAAVSGVSVSGSSSSAQIGDGPDMHFDIAGPTAPTAWLPEHGLSGGGWGGSSDGATWTSFGLATGTMPMATALADWHDVRVEAWHGMSGNDPNSFGLDPRYSSPFAIEPANIHDNSIDASFRFGQWRDAKSWWLILTGVGPDGHRYVLSAGGGGGSSFNGSAWDWLTAPQ
jgi:hypothetical protein